MEFFTELEKNSEIYMEAKDAEQPKQWGRQHQARPQIILQSHSDKTSMVLAQTQTYRPMEQIEGPEANHTTLTVAPKPL